MAGLTLGLGGGVRLGPSLGNQPPATIAQTAYGQENSPNVMSNSGLKSWHLGVIVPVAGVMWLAFLRWSLPR